MTSKNYKQLVDVMLDNTQYLWVLYWFYVFFILTFNILRKGRKSKSKISLWGAVDRAEALLKEDIKV